MVNRCRMQILAEILIFCEYPQMKTRIMYSNNMSWHMANYYLSELLSRDLMEEAHGNPTKYVTTKRGRDFVKKWNELEEVFNKAKK